MGTPVLRNFEGFRPFLDYIGIIFYYLYLILSRPAGYCDLLCGMLDLHRAYIELFTGVCAARSRDSTDYIQRDSTAQALQHPAQFLFKTIPKSTTIKVIPIVLDPG